MSPLSESAQSELLTLCRNSLQEFLRHGTKDCQESNSPELLERPGCLRYTAHAWRVARLHWCAGAALTAVPGGSRVRAVGSKMRSQIFSNDRSGTARRQG
jgi:hypothetical protein